MWHSNFSNFWVAPCIFSSWDCVQLPSSEVVVAFDLFIHRSRLADRMKGIGGTGFLLLIMINVLMVCRLFSLDSKLFFNTSEYSHILFTLHIAELDKVPYKSNSLHIWHTYVYLHIQRIYLWIDQYLKLDKMWYICSEKILCVAVILQVILPFMLGEDHSVFRNTESKILGFSVVLEHPLNAAFSNIRTHFIMTNFDTVGIFLYVISGMTFPIYFSKAFGSCVFQ